MSTAIDLFIEEARAVTVTEAAGILGIPITSRNYAGPCPSCGGNDRFSISPARQAWNCRGCGKGGRDGIGLMALANGHDIGSRSGFLGACSDVTGKPVPDAGEAETEEERRAREARLAARRSENERAAAERGRQENQFRDREISKARGIWLNAPEQACREVVTYLRLRTGFDMDDQVFANVRGIERCTYWHGRDERGYEVAYHTGPAMVLPFVNLDGKITGCHQTWIDLANAKGKFRPDLGTDDKGVKLPTKKMRGTKKGSLVPLFGLMSSARWVGGEGIENGLTIAGSEGFRADTFYFAAGDLGNLAGPADPKSNFAHPHIVKEAKGGRLIAVRVQGPEPKPDQGPDDAMQVPDHVTELILLGDGDSDPVVTAAAMVRAEKRLSRPGRDVWEWHAPPGTDFSGLMTGR